MAITLGSLFAGIGGLDLGLERAGMKVVWQVEIDPYCRKVLAKHWPDVERHNDVKECGQHNLQPVDLICGGFPCQSVSFAGKRCGAADNRWLWPEFHRIIRLLGPRWVLAENVPGLLSIDAGRLFGGILRDLAACGYGAEWDCIPAAAVGAPHIRYRVFIIANRYDGGQRRVLQLERQPECDVTTDIGGDGEARPVANTDSWRQQERTELNGESPETSTDRCTCGAHACRCRDDLADSQCDLLQEQSIFQSESGVEQDDSWPIEPDVDRVAHGVPARVERLRGLGNAVVPQVSEWIGRRIVEADNCVGCGQ